MSRQLAEASSSFLARRLSRRGVLVRLAVVGSAMTMSPLRYILRPGTAYASICGPSSSCSSGYTAMCCTVSGTNRCPPGSFAGGWWKADNSGFCCGNGARYYIDCNLRCGQTCQCHCASGTCDQRKVCCNLFRYGQCNQQIACYGPIVCRVVSCSPPWTFDPSCTGHVLVDNATAQHSAPCLPGSCATAIDGHWYRLGAERFLGWPVSAELGTPDGVGRFRHYERRGSIYWTPATAAHVVVGAIRGKWQSLGWERGFLRYPVTDELGTPDGVGRFNHFQGGSIYWTPATGAHVVVGAIRGKWRAMGAETSVLGYPLTDELGAPDGVGRFHHFQRGSIYWTPATGAHEVHGAIQRRYKDEGETTSSLRFPVTDVFAISGGERCEFQGGAIEWDASTDTTTVIPL